MRCENNFCIYWSEDRCTVDEISIDYLGRCDACTFVNIEEEVLCKAREKILRSYKEQQALWDK